MKVGFAGLGAMGFLMAENILKKGFPLQVYNRTKQKAQPLLEKGAMWAETPRTLAKECDVIITMVSDDEALKTIVYGDKGILAEKKKGLIHVSMSTVSPAIIQTLEKEHQDAGGALVTATVTGLPERAKAGTLWIFCSGDPKSKEKVKPVLEAMGSKIIDFGTSAKQASVFKLCNNFMILSLIESLSEALVLLEKNGISNEKAVEAWTIANFDSPIFRTYGEVLSKKLFHPARFALELGFKDMRLLEAFAEQSDMPMPLLDLLHEKLVACVAQGRNDYDWSVIALLTRERAGLK